MAGAGTSSLTMEGLKLFEKFATKTDLVRVYVEAADNFTKEELAEYTATFIKYDINRSGDLDVFELNKMYEARGETKTSAELNALVKTLGDEFGASLKKDGVTYKAFLSVLLKDKKGTTKTSWGSFATVAKKHDQKTATGKIANSFEQKAAEGAAEEKRKMADIEMRRAANKMKTTEAQRKAAKQKALAAFQANIHGAGVTGSVGGGRPDV